MSSKPSYHGIETMRTKGNVKPNPMHPRTIRGLGTAMYTDEEDVLCRDLIDGGHSDEVRLLHEIKVAFRATAVHDDDFEMLRRRVMRERLERGDDQLALEAA